VRGAVAPELVQALRDDIAKDECTNPVELVSEVKATKQRGQGMFQEGKYKPAYAIWQEATYIIDRLHYSTSWPILTERGGQPFITDVAHLQFLLHLNLAQAALKAWDPMYSHPTLVTEPLTSAEECMHMGY
jgi:hypothetical protein